MSTARKIVFWTIAAPVALGCVALILCGWIDVLTGPPGSLIAFCALVWFAVKVSD